MNYLLLESLYQQLAKLNIQRISNNIVAYIIKDSIIEETIKFEIEKEKFKQKSSYY